MERERTFIMIKPDAVQRGLIGEIINRFVKKGYKLIAMKLMQIPRSLAEQHYAEHKDKPFFESLIQYTTSAPVVAMVWEGKEIVATARVMIGATDPLKAAPGSIRGTYGVDLGRNVIHASDSKESAKREIELFFKPEEILTYSLTLENWLYE
ncbi:nucleoside-diphosphate kinase [Peptococcaceae bacterium]|nr:nucleoside-diphosphate kinase [Peptococcaceae bacterium]MCL0041772.1 nucleoside-diphosphate kinase [Peptococcaceae bacterium]